VILTTTAALKMQQNQWLFDRQGAVALARPHDLRDGEAVSLHLPNVLDQLLS
jgi:hypothetical protein